jgi:hypothetical protein
LIFTVLNKLTHNVRMVVVRRDLRES